ncbi:MAG: hypothetical protein IAG10_04960, partial [Planctomycetaceae bacterium]|nr:hypothetical protein [Planctomycetaceae bacterium]
TATRPGPDVPDSPKASAAEAVDLLLGTQGWRRFVVKNSTQPNPDFRQQVAKLIDLDGRAHEPAAFDNGPEIERHLAVHSYKLNAAWSQLLDDGRVVLVVILTAWLLSILMRPRWRPAGASLWMLLAASGTSCVLVGCGYEASMQKATPAKSGAANAPQATAKPSSQRVGSPFGDVVSESAKFSDASEPSEESVRAFLMPPQSNVSPPDASRTTPPATTPQKDADTDASGKATGSGTAPAKDPLAMRLLTADDLRRLLAARGLDADGLSGTLLDELRFPVREYAHKHVRRESGLREDFAETLFWQPLLITDANGEATIRFDLSDSVTTFRVLADAHTGDGRIGSGGGEVLSRLPFQIEPKLPLEVTTGDRIDLPVAVINRTNDQQQVQIGLSADGTLQVVGDKSRSVMVAANDQGREHISLNVTHGSAESDAFIELRGIAGGFNDAVRRKLHVAPSGYPVRESLAGVINGTERLRLKIPSDAVPGSLAVTLRAYPSPLADLLSGVESILGEPHGCFEQTTSTNYPNTMALQYLQQNQLANPNVTRKAKDFLDRGYQKLTSFECKQRGYEWFGSDPGHEALTAFGLMQYHDMAEVMPVDAEMVERTRTWLLNRRNGQGGFHRNPRHLHVWSVQQDLVDAYVLWALTEADAARNLKSQNSNLKSQISDLKTELDHLTVIANASRDSYLIALSAAALLNAGRTADGDRLLQTLTELQAADGSLTGSTTVTQSGGLSLKMETTALATIAWLKSPRFNGSADRAAKWIVTHREGHGGFGSTQATVLALKALIGYAKTAGVARRGGTLQVVRDQEVLAQMTLPEGTDASSTIELTGIGSKLVPGETELELRAPGFGRLSFALEVLYHTPKPPSDPNCPVQLSAKLANENAETPTLKAGDTVRLEAMLKNTTERGLPMTVAVLGFPAGLEPRAEELNELRDAGAFDYYELRPREVLFYWRTIHPQAEHHLAITLTATIPGEYTAPASRTYLYYTAEQKHWTEPLRVRITP